MGHGSTAISAAWSRWRRGRLFVAAMLLALASALIPALFPAGSTAIRAAGSAFDPTTNMVSLRGRAQIIVRAAALENGDADKAPAATIAPALPAIPASEILRARPARPSGEAAGLPSPRPAGRQVTQAQPRAPPFASA